MPTPGPYSLVFELEGFIMRDTGGGLVNFSLTGIGLDDHWTQPEEGGHWLVIDTIFYSSPLFLLGSYRYTADVSAWAIGLPLDSGQGEAKLHATFLGLDQVGCGVGIMGGPDPVCWGDGTRGGLDPGWGGWPAGIDPGRGAGSVGASVPEPGTWILLASGSIGMLLLKLRRSRL